MAERGWRLLSPLSNEPLFTPGELFDAFLKAESMAERPGSPGTLYFNHETAPRVFSRQRGARTPAASLPKRSDGSFERYAERIRRDLATEHYCLRLTELHAYAPAIWKRLCECLQPIQIDANRTIRTTVFVGHYEYTPFGVHVDPYPQIQCVTVGDREALFWNADYWKPFPNGDEERLAPWNHLLEADRIKMTAGDAVFWAGFEEHAFSSSGGFAIALTISFPQIEAPDSMLEAARRRSAHRFLNVPGARPSTTTKQSFRGSTLFPIELVDSSLVGAGNVFSLECPIDGQRRFVERVNNSAKAFTANDAAADLGVEPDGARAVLDALYAHHVLETGDP